MSLCQCHFTFLLFQKNFIYFFNVLMMIFSNLLSDFFKKSIIYFPFPTDLALHYYNYIIIIITNNGFIILFNLHFS